MGQKVTVKDLLMTSLSSIRLNKPLIDLDIIKILNLGKARLNHVTSYKSDSNPAAVINDRSDYKWIRRTESKLYDVFEEFEKYFLADFLADDIADKADCMKSFAHSFLKSFDIISFLGRFDICIPDIGILMDGGIEFDWCSEDPVSKSESGWMATLWIYGNDGINIDIVYGVSTINECKNSGTCKLVDLLDNKIPHSFYEFIKFIED